MAAEAQSGEQQWQSRLLALALRKVQESYRDYNASLFAGRLSPPQLSWSESERVLGAWRRSSRTLTLSLSLLDRGWGEVMEVLKHEMAHQYVDEVLGIGPEEGPHGASFQKVCAERGIDGRTSSAPAASEQSGSALQDLYSDEQLRVFRRIEYLFSLAQSENEHEAQAAMRAAQRLMLKHNIEAALQGPQSQYAYRHLGQPTGRRMAWQRVLGNILSEHFFVEIIIVPVYRPREAKRGSVLEACGTPANLEIAAYVHDFLERAALGSWKSHKKAHSLKGDGDKQSFLYGVMRGFAEKLEKEAAKSQQEGLIWVGDPQLRSFFRARHPYVRAVSGKGQVSRDAFSAGHQAGGRIVLHRGVEAGSNGGAPRLLGSGGRV